MRFTIQKSVQATRDIEEAFVYIAEDNLDVAVRFLGVVEESTNTLAVHPLIGNAKHLHNTKLGNLRM